MGLIPDRPSSLMQLPMGELLSQQLPLGSLLDFASTIGTPFSAPGMPAVHTLSPRAMGGTGDNHYTGNYGRGAFPFHTDLANWHVPPRYILFRCLVADVHVTTHLVLWDDIEETVGVDTVKQARVMPRRRVGNRRFRLRLRQGPIRRWDPLFLVPANDDARKFKRFMDHLVPQEVGSTVQFERPGDLLLLDNWTMMHSRSEAPAGSQRCIERVYLSAVF
jgi:L-asparagine oxygenase